MKLLKNYTHIHGFEEYNIVSLYDFCLTASWSWNVPYSFDNSTGFYIINKDLPTKPYNIKNPQYSWAECVKFVPQLVTNHKELLSTAKKVFTHSTCKLSRSMMAEKYKKSLNPFLSDAVIIPNPDYNEFNLREQALFINDDAKLIVRVFISEDKAQNTIKNAQEGVKLRDLIISNPDDSYGTCKPYTIHDMLNSEFFYYGEVLYVPNSQSWAMEILTHSLPADKIVFEESVQESLSSETNQLDFDSLCSIKDMLESSDENTVSAGLKSLSMMDWMHYPQSIKFILNNVKDKYNWIYNKACTSTSVKYMMQTICNVKRRSWWPGDYDGEIYEEDFELFKKLKCHYHHVLPEKVMSTIRALEFMSVNSEGMIAPNIKQRT